MFLKTYFFRLSLFRFLSLSLIVGLTPCAAQAFYVNSVKLEQITPTKNKKEVREIITLNNADRHQAEFEKLILETTVNSSVMLKDYIMLHLKNLTELIEQVQANVKPVKSNKNEKLANLTINILNGPAIEFKDVYRNFSLTGYFESHFAKYIIENGVKDKVSQSDSSPKSDKPKPN